MARLDVYRITARQYALDCQAENLRYLMTRFVVPLLRPIDVPSLTAGHLHPVFDVDSKPMIMATHLAGAVPAKKLKDKIDTLADEHYAVQRALGLLMTGV